MREDGTQWSVTDPHRNRKERAGEQLEWCQRNLKEASAEHSAAPAAIQAPRRWPAEVLPPRADALHPSTGAGRLGSVVGELTGLKLAQPRGAIIVDKALKIGVRSSVESAKCKVSPDR